MRGKVKTIYYSTGQADGRGVGNIETGGREKVCETDEMKTNKPSSIPFLLCCSVPLKGHCAFLLPAEREGRRLRKQRRRANPRDLSIEGRGSGCGSGNDSEFLIIATATSHLATGYTMAAVALATAWSLSVTRGE